jgi:hypothetical protein
MLWGNLLEPSKRLRWIGTIRMLVDVGVPGKPGGRQWKRKLEKQAKHGGRQWKRKLEKQAKHGGRQWKRKPEKQAKHGTK